MQSPTAIPRPWVELAIARGIRTNVPNGCPTRPWVHKFMYHGLHVTTDVSHGTILHVHWAVTDPEALSQCGIIIGEQQM